MQHADRPERPASAVVALWIPLVHAALLVTVLLVLVWFGVGSPWGPSLAYADTRPPAASLQLEEEDAQAEQVLPPVPVPPREEWRLSGEMLRVLDYVARRYRVSALALEPVFAAAEQTARRVGIDPLLIVAVIAIESSFNPLAESQAGAQGLMQVIPRFHQDKFDAARGENALFDPLLNVQVGTRVLLEGLHRFGTLEHALQYYAGALNDPAAAYANKVFEMKRGLMSAAGRMEGSDA